MGKIIVLEGQNIRISPETAMKIANKKIFEFLTAEPWQELVSHANRPDVGYIQKQGSGDPAREVFSIPCPGFANLPMPYFRRKCGCDHLTDIEVIDDCCKNDRINNIIEDLAYRIYSQSLQ